MSSRGQSRHGWPPPATRSRSSVSLLVHTYLLAEQGTPIIELVYLEELSQDQVFEFAFIGGSLKLRGADAAPIRPIAIPLRN